MKIPSLLLSASLLVALSTPLSAQVYSNIVGFQEVVNEPGKFSLLGSPWANPTNNLATVIGDQVGGGTELADADSVWFWNKSNNSYTKRILGGESLSALESAFGYPLAGEWLDPNTYAPSTEEVNPGQGFWLVNNSGLTNTIILTGDVVTNETISVTIEEGLNLLAYPFSADIAVSNLNFTATGGAKGGSALADSDSIWLWNEASSSYQKYIFGGAELAGLESTFGYDLVEQWLDPNTYAPAEATIEAGQGFWYSRLTGESSLTWSEDRPYDPFAP